MKIKKYQKLKSNKYKVTLDNDEIITLYDEVILNNNLLLTKEINDIDLISKENDYYDAYFTALKYIQKKMRTKKEIKDHLKNKYDSEVIDNVLLKMGQDNYLNDELYIKSYVHDQVLLTNNGYYKIYNHLKNNNLDEELIKKYLDEIDNDIWLEKLNKIINKKIKLNNKYSGNKLKEKLLYDLNNLGYNKNDILNIVNKLDIKEDNLVLEKNYKVLYNKLSKKYEGKELELQLINKLMTKGFKYNDIKKVMINN